MPQVDPLTTVWLVTFRGPSGIAEAALLWGVVILVVVGAVYLVRRRRR